MTAPKVSVIIPVYNAQDYLRECLDSVVNQTVRDMEIICVNDGSTDGSGTILEEYATRDSRFIVVSQENAGLSATRNRGLELARGEFVSFLDSDDFFERDMLEKTLWILENPEIDVVLFFFQKFGKDYRTPKKKCLPCVKPIYEEMWEKLNVIASMFGVVWNQVYRREFLEKYQIRFLEGCLYEDTHFSAKCAYYSRKLAVLPEVLCHYRIGSGFSTGTKRCVSLRRLPETYRRLLDDFQKCVFPEELIEYFRGRYYNSLRRVYRKAFSSEERPKFREELLAELTEFDWKQIGGENRFLPVKTRCFFFWLKGKPTRAVGELLKSLWRKSWTLEMMVQREKFRKREM
ncbi:MAG: glycosyltransferase [Planctomycetia bacterium]|nr:glycosyltransferase [Planctomycetia bacterium]